MGRKRYDCLCPSTFDSEQESAQVSGDYQERIPVSFSASASIGGSASISEEEMMDSNPDFSAASETIDDGVVMQDELEAALNIYATSVAQDHVPIDQSCFAQSLVVSVSKLHEEASKSRKMLAALVEENVNLHDQIKIANAEVAALKQDLESNQSKVYELNRRHAILGKPTKLINNMVQQLLDSNVSSKAIVHDVISDLMSKKYFHKHVGKCITKNVTLLPQVADQFEPKIYGEICHKFRGWICLQQLDM
jgi:hypothetical protein